MVNANNLIEEKSAEVEEFYSEQKDGLIYLSHASILVNLNNKKYLFDPVLAKPPHLGSWLFFPKMEMDKRLLEVDAVFVSHQHQDHYDAEFLKMLPAETPVYVVSGRPQFTNMLKKEQIACTELKANKVIDLGDGVSCLGINHEYNGIDAAIVISNGRFTVYHGNDCFVSHEKLKIIKDAYPRINVACTPFAYVHWYPFLLEEVDETWKSNEAERLISEYLDYGIRQIDYLRPDIAIPFGANMFYFDDINSEHNKAVLSPFDFIDFAEKKKFEFRDRILPLFSGDKIYSVEVSGKRELDIRCKGISRQDLINGFSKYLEYVHENGTGFDARSIEALTYDDIKDYSFICGRLKCADKTLDHNIYISNIENPQCCFIEIRLSSHSVDRRNEIDSGTPYHHFKLTDLAYKAYFSQKCTFNEVVASSRFKLVRKPNDYALDVLKIVNNIL